LSDARLEQWLELTEATLQAPAERRLEALEKLAESRAELQRSLETDPPVAEPSLDLAQRLARSEQALQSMLEQMRVELSARVAAVRGVRRGASGYRPTVGNRPAFLSRSA